MDEFIQENMEKKAVILGFKKLKQKINAEIIKHAREFRGYSKGILIIGTNYARLMLEVIERGLSEDFDVSRMDFVDNSKSKLSIWNIPIYVAQEENVVMLINSLGEMYEDDFGIDCWTQKLGNFNLTEEELNALIDELPDSSKLRRVSPEEMV